MKKAILLICISLSIFGMYSFYKKDNNLKNKTTIMTAVNLSADTIKPFVLPPLPYAYDALEPYIDAKTMEIHYTKHHQAYINNLNAALKGTKLEGKTIEEILKSCKKIPAVRNNAGGYWNHNMFWEIMAPNAGGEPTGALADAIKRDFGSFSAFKDEFSKAGATRFGSGWAWLCVNKKGELEVCSTANQDNPLMGEGCKGTPILCMDVWEHAYYLKYQNKRVDYISAFFNVINWKVVTKKYEEAI